MNNSGQNVKSVKILCIFGKHVSNKKELTVTSENMQNVIFVYYYNQYRILESIFVLNLVTPGSEFFL
jgi:hypothetical protein